MKKIFKGLLVMALVLFVSACGGSSAPKDGFYQAAGQPTDSGWTYFMTFDVKDGKITNVDYNGVNLAEGVKDKKVDLSKAGGYKLAPGNAGEWHVQAEKINKYIEENQGLDGVEFNDEGKSDAIAGATIHYDDTVDLLKNALDAGPVEQGDLTDGIYFAEDKKFDDKGFKYTLGYFVNHGVILAVQADAYQMGKDDDGKEVKQFKTVLAKEGKYDLGEEAVASYDKQAQAVNDYILKNGNLDVEVNEEGKTDAISGATVSVGHWVTLFKEAQLVK